MVLAVAAFCPLDLCQALAAGTTTAALIPCRLAGMLLLLLRVLLPLLPAALPRPVRWLPRPVP